MSAIPLLEPIAEPAVLPRQAPNYRTAIQTNAGVVVGARVRPRPRVIRISLVTILGNAMAFIIIAGFASFVASLLGNVMVEQARRDGIRAMERARLAARHSVSLREEVQAMTSTRAIEEWARTNGFVAASSAPLASAEKNVAEVY